MAKNGPPQDNNDSNLLAPDETDPFTVLNPDSAVPLLMVCDHASRRIPVALGNMGLDPIARRCHLAWDIGAKALTESLADSLGATAVLAEYSRLVVDCNRNLFDPGAFLEFGDGVVIYGNRRLNRTQKEQRAAEIYWPYHNAVDAEVNRLSALGRRPAFFSIHSFTPVLNGVARDVEIGILWDKDRPTAERVIEGFKKAGFKVGDNEPYSGKAPQDFTVDHHAEKAQMAHAGIEIRQDLISDDAGVGAMAEALHTIFESLLEHDDSNRLALGPTGS